MLEPRMMWWSGSAFALSLGTGVATARRMNSPFWPHAIERSFCGWVSSDTNELITEPIVRMPADRPINCHAVARSGHDSASMSSRMFSCVRTMWRHCPDAGPITVPEWNLACEGAARRSASDLPVTSISSQL